MHADPQQKHHEEDNGKRKGRENGDKGRRFAPNRESVTLEERDEMERTLKEETVESDQHANNADTERVDTGAGRASRSEGGPIPFTDFHKPEYQCSLRRHAELSWKLSRKQTNKKLLFYKVFLVNVTFEFALFLVVCD